MVRVHVKQKEADDLCWRLLDASSSVIGMQGEKLKLEQKLAEMKAKPTFPTDAFIVSVIYSRTLPNRVNDLLQRTLRFTRIVLLCCTITLF